MKCAITSFFNVQRRDKVSQKKSIIIVVMLIVLFLSAYTALGNMVYTMDDGEEIRITTYGQQTTYIFVFLTSGGYSKLCYESDYNEQAAAWLAFTYGETHWGTASLWNTNGQFFDLWHAASASHSGCINNPEWLTYYFKYTFNCSSGYYPTCVGAVPIDIRVWGQY